MNPFVSRITHNQNWVIPVSAISVVLGFMIATARVTGSARISLANAEQQRRLLSGPLGTQVKLRELQTELNNTRQEVTRLQNAVAEQTSGTKVLNESLQEVKVFAGLTPVTGPGVTVTLRDGRSASDEPNRQEPSPDRPLLPDEEVIHDQDILRVVNELYAADAEALSINNIRLGPSSSIRCVGPTVLVDDVRLAPPLYIRAIGSPDTLDGALNMPGGIVEAIRDVNPRMIEVHKNDSLTMPAYAGATTRKFLKVSKANP